MADDALEIRRVLPAPPDLVFAAWTDASWLARWISPVGHARVEADPRPGGRLRVVMVGDDRAIAHVGEFLEVEPPHRLSFTWSSASPRHTRASPVQPRSAGEPLGTMSYRGGVIR